MGEDRKHKLENFRLIYETWRNNMKERRNKMDKVTLTKRASDVLSKAISDLRENKCVVAQTAICTENSGIVIPCMDFNYPNIYEYFDIITMMIKQHNASAVIFTHLASIKIVDSRYQITELNEDTNSNNALVLLASMPNYHILFIVFYEEKDGQIVFDEMVSYEGGKSISDTTYSKTFIDVWNSIEKSKQVDCSEQNVDNSYTKECVL